jgi:hypothetical protein
VDVKMVRALHWDCSMKLQRFIKEAGKLCDLLAKMEEFPLSRPVQSATALAGRKEEVALAEYQDARRKFFQAAISSEEAQQKATDGGCPRNTGYKTRSKLLK